MNTKSNILKLLEELTSLTFNKEVKLNSIIIVGSNYDCCKKENLDSLESDIDVIILTDSENFSINQEYNNVNFDVSFLNQNDVISLVLGAVNGSSFYGKVFSSISQYKIIKDTNNVGFTFISVVKNLYELFTNSCLPNYKVSDVLLHNILVNERDLKKRNKEESFFALHRLSEHLFNYISYLVYPFQTSGSYRGKVIGKYLEGFHNSNSKEKVLDKALIESNISMFCPVLKSNFRCVFYDEKIKEAISNNKINTYYFGCNELVLEKIVIFLLEKDILDNNLKLEKMVDIIPFLSKKEIEVYTKVVVFLSKKYFNSSIKERIEILLSIFNDFVKIKLDKVIVESLKSVLILKSIEELTKEGYKISILGFHDWLFDLKLALLPNKKSIPEELCFQKIIKMILESKTIKEREIKTSYIFFGVMKSLRVNVGDLNFN
ncbi:hypothetical protein V1T75_05285 [Tenacibaculum sp. FZY0031]|uniref:hypothetical protein n=1 Tax=Tenacibaculum sp. FZY0031 TaxID=3116648 RepID=UPI002E9CCB6A|nr:hypothetical protein [Tenacibaculum sp. FZY0031]